MNNVIGKNTWVFPDGELPPPGNQEMKGHESLIILNLNNVAANPRITFYFTDKDPISVTLDSVGEQRVKCYRLNEPEQIGGVEIPLEVQYAIKIDSDIPIITQFGRLDTRQSAMAFYTTMGFSN